VKTDNPGSTRANPLIAAVVVSVMILSVIGVAAITGVVPSTTSPRIEGMALAESAIRAEITNCALCGTVESIRTVELRDEAGGGLGGGLAAAAIGKDGSTTIVGTDGTAASGSEIGTSVKKRYAHRVTVRMDDGSYRTVSLSSPPALAVGDKVRVVEGKLVRT
jgi:outer membrane lipoprotein SlyB